MPIPPLRMNSQQPPPLPIAVLQCPHSTNYIHHMIGANNVRQPDRTRVGSLSSGLYEEICVTFDTGPPGKDWKALAGWLGFIADEVKRFEQKNCQTDCIISYWSTEVANNIEKFIRILIDNKMTNLAGKIEMERGQSVV